MRLKFVSPLRWVVLCCLTNVSSEIRGAENCCDHCQGADCRKICRLVHEEKKVTITCWGFQDEDFCVPGPSRPGCKHSDRVCQDCDPCGKVCSRPKLFVWREWCPEGCPELLTRRKLMKRTETKTISTYKWVVEDLCPGCRQACTELSVPDGVLLPRVPKLGPEVQLIGAIREKSSQGFVSLPD